MGRRRGVKMSAHPETYGDPGTLPRRHLPPSGPVYVAPTPHPSCWSNLGWYLQAPPPPSTSLRISVPCSQPPLPQKAAAAAAPPVAGTTVPADLLHPPLAHYTRASPCCWVCDMGSIPSAPGPRAPRPTARKTPTPPQRPQASSALCGLFCFTCNVCIGSKLSNPTPTNYDIS